MSQQTQRQVPKFPVVNFNQVFAAIDPLSIIIGIGGGALLFYVIQKYGIKKCIK